MATLKDFRDERLRKLEDIKALGINPYPAEAHRTHDTAEVLSGFEKLESNNVTVVGRILAIRKFGKLAFIVVKDESGSIQLFMRDSGDHVEADRTNSELSMPSEISLLDTGDFIEASGTVIKTQTGEISVEIQKLRLLTKALRPMPSAQDGFTDKEQRLRRRYIDTNVNDDAKQRYVRRSKFWTATRDFLNERGFLEVNIPVLEHTTGGADANPFVTHMDALDQDFFLRISHELPLKRLIGGGYEKVYDIGPRFRNENYTEEHLPEHIAMEWYWAYANWEQGMQLMEDMFSYVLEKTFGTTQFNLRGFEIDFSKPWAKLDYATVIKDEYGIDVYNCTLEEVQKALKDHKLEVEKTDNIPRSIDKLWKRIRATHAGPSWLINTPLFISPLAKSNPHDPNTVQRFQAVIAGSELCNGYSELNDPIDQLNRFVEQEAMREAGDAEAQMLDIDYVEMLEYGMPPTCGLGFSERVFWIFEGVSAREGVPFPQMRTEVDEVTRGIYGEVLSADKGVAAHEKQQDFTKRIISVVRKDLEPWRVANAVAHMQTIIGSRVASTTLTSGATFDSSDGGSIPRNSQYPIIIMRADEKELHKLYDKVKAEHLVHHVFIKEMQDTTNDQEIVEILKEKTLMETEFFGLSFFAENEIADRLTKGLQLWK
jgi:lysyl-tRNA synthetase, class II